MDARPPVMTERRLTLAFVADPESVHVRRWLGAFVQRGHRIHLFMPRTAVPTPGMAEGVQLQPYEDYGRRLRPLGALRATASLRTRLRMVRPDVVHAHYVTRYGWLARMADVQPLVVTAWGSDVFRTGEMSPYARWLTRSALSNAKLVTVVGEALGAAAVAAGARPDRVRVVQFGVDAARFAPGPAPDALRARLGLGGRRLVFAPRWIRPVYRQDVVVAALEALPADAVLLMTTRNGDPELVGRLRAAAERSGVSERLRLVDAIDHAEMPDLFRLADVVVSVPETDAFSVTALEAMACGRPLVLSDLPSAREGLGGVDPAGLAATRLVPVGDVGTTGAAIRELLELEPGARSAAAGALRTAALARGDERREMDRMEGFYLAIAEGLEPGP